MSLCSASVGRRAASFPPRCEPVAQPAVTASSRTANRDVNELLSAIPQGYASRGRLVTLRWQSSFRLRRLTSTLSIRRGRPVFGPPNKGDDPQPHYIDPRYEGQDGPPSGEAESTQDA